MKRKLFLMMLFMATSITAWSADGDQFTEESNGITLTYTIVSESDKTCATAAQTSLPVDAAIVIPSTANGYNVIGIGYRSFRNFAIKSISFPNGLKYIGEEAFEGCSHLTGTLLIPKTVTSISRQAFKDCNMTSVRLLGGVKTVGIEAFRECTSLTQVTMGEGVETIGESMFSGCTNLATVYFPSTITSIGANAFSGTAWNTNLPEGMTYIGTIAYKYKNVDGNTTVTIKDGTKSISRYAFASSNVTSITIPTSLTAINEYAFEKCNSLSTITTSGIGSMWSVYLVNLEEIGDYAFSGCSSIESVYLPSTIKTISKGLFYNCTSLTSVQTSNLTGIGASAFCGCSNLATFTIPNSVTSIGQTAFYGCEKLKEINIPQGVSGIGQMTFENCKGLTTVKLHEGITAIGIRAFSNCTGLTEITIPGTLRTMETWDNCWAFSGCTGLKKITINEGAALLGVNTFLSCYNVETVVCLNQEPISVYDSFKSFATNATLYVPSGCTAAYAEASYWKDFKSIVEMPDNVISFKDSEVRDICISNWDTNGDGFLSKGEAAAVTDIGKTFQSKGKIRFFDELKYFTGIQSIGKEAFENCSSLSSVTIPENVTSIGQQAFRYCNFSTIVIPEKVKTIASEAFQGCSQLTSIDIPFGVTVLNKGVFDGCTCLESIHIPNSVETIGDKAFRSCKGFVAIDIPNGVTSLGGSVFEGCTNLASVSFPESLTTIGTYIFENCPALEAISVNDNNATFESPQGSNAIIKKVTKTLVLGCKTTVVPTDVKVIGNFAFYKCTGLSSINLPESVETIEQSAFYKCAGLSSIQFPDALTSIGDYAFESCSALTSITLPANVRSIGREAFEYCSGLTSVTALRETPAEIGNSAFYPRTDVTLYVPAGCKDAYQTAWGTFKEIVELTDGASFVVSYPFGNITYKILSITDKTCEVSYSSSLKGEVVIPSSVNGYQVIGFGSYAFEEEEDFTSIVIPPSITYMRNGAFKRTYHKSVYISNLEAWCRIDFDGYLSNAINGCNLYVNGELVTDLVIPNTITAIKPYAFCHSQGVTSVTLHENVASIGESAFYGISGLTSVTVGASEPVAITSDVFSNSSNVILNVPVGCKAAYQEADYWNMFNKILELEAEPVSPSFAESTIIPWGTDKAWEMKYMYFDEIGNVPATDGSGHAWTDVDFDDSSWSILTGPIARYRTDFSDVNTLWEKEGSCYYLRRTFELSNVNEAGYYFCSQHDDNVKVWINGTQVVDAGLNGKRQYYHIPASAFVEGTNTLAIYLDDTGGGAYLDYSMQIMYSLKNVETGQYLNVGNAYGTHAVLADEPLPVCINKQSDGSYTVFFPVGSRNSQLLFRYGDTNVYVDYNAEFEDACPYWTFTDAGDGNFHIQTLTTHPTFGQEAMPGTYLGNDPNKEANQDGNSFGVFNDVDGNVVTGKNITWKLEVAPASHTASQVSQLQVLVTKAEGLGLDRWYAEALLGNEKASYTEMLGTILDLEARIKSCINAKVEDLSRLIACANAIGVSTDAAQAVADNPQDMESVNNAISTLHAAYIAKLGEGVDGSLLPLDVTGVILNPSFVIDNADGWSWNDVEGGPGFGNNNAEYRERTFNFHQTISGLPNGNYVLKVKGFHRPGNKDAIYSDFMQDVNNAKAKLYANDESVTLKNIAAEARESQIDDWSGIDVSYDNQQRFIPDNNNDARVWFATGYYENELAVTVTDGTLTLGVRLDESVEEDWVCFDDFRLIYNKDYIINGDMEGNDVSCFYLKKPDDTDPVPSTIVDGEGKDGSRCIVVNSADNPANIWDTQFYVRLTKPLPAGTRYHLKFDYKASQEAEVHTQSQQEPGGYLEMNLLNNLYFTEEWQTYDEYGVISDSQSPADKMQTIAFDLAVSESATTYYFDNFFFEIDNSPSFAESTIIPWGTEKAWEMKYVYFDEIGNGNVPVTDGSGHAWSDVDFDDSSWATLTGPIARYENDFSVVNTIWEKENSCYYLRRTFNLDEVDEQGYYFCSRHDDNVKVWINGTQVVEAGFNGRYQYHHIPASKFVKGTNTMAIYLDDIGGGANLDYCMANFYFLKNVETGKYLNADNEWRAVLADEGLPVKLYKQADGSYTIYFPYGSQNQQLLYRTGEEGVCVDYSKEWAPSGCPNWTFTDAGEGHIYIQSLTTHPTYGQEAMPGTYVGNNPSSNYVAGNINVGNNITWTVEALPARTETQTARLQELVTAAKGIWLDTSDEEAVLNNSEATYMNMLETIYELQNRINEEQRAIWAVTSTDDIPAGTVIELEDITMTIGEAGSPNFTISSYKPYNETFKNLISGNGVNGNKEGGTFYLFKPKKNGDLIVVVNQNKTKKFYVEESGRVMDAFNGITKEEEVTEGNYIGPYTIPVFANLTYKVYCAGSKMGFYGFVFKGRDDAEWTNIEFADEKVKALCVANWDTDHNGELSMTEAAAVTDLGEVFKENGEITSFDELRFFTGLTEIGDGAFSKCSNLTSVILPEGLESIGGSSFRWAGLTSIKFPQSLINIDGYAFTDCASLASIDFNGCSATIYEVAFAGCHSLTEVTVPSTCTLTGWDHFGYCNSLKSATILAQTGWTDGLLRNCPELETVVLGSTNLLGGSAFAESPKTKTVTIQKVEDIRPYEYVMGVNHADCRFIIPEGTAEQLLKGGFRNLSDMSALPLVKDVYEAETARVQAMADGIDSGDKTALTAAITTANDIVDAAEDYPTVFAQIDAVNTAAKAFLAAATLAENTDVTAAAIIDPNFDSNLYTWNGQDDGLWWGWNGEQSFSNGDIAINRFVEKNIWEEQDGALADGARYLFVGNLPAGRYRLECDAIATWQHDASVQVTGVSLFAGDQQTPIATENEKPQHFSVDFTLITRSDCKKVGIQVKGTNANWVAFDNVRLTYLGAREESTEDYMIDYSDYSGFPFWSLGYIPEWYDGVMTDMGGDYTYEAVEGAEHTSDVIVKTNDGTEYYRLPSENTWHQYFIAQGIPTKVGGKYTVKAMVKASEPCSVNVNMLWGWEEGQQINAIVHIGTEWQEVEWEYYSIGGTSCDLLAQPDTKAQIEWKWLTVSQETRPLEWVEQLTNGDAERQWTSQEKNTRYDDTANNYKICAWGRENGRNLADDGFVMPFPADIVEVEDDNHAFVVHAQDCTDPDSEASAWDNQFWIQSPKSWKTGRRVKLHFRYKASQAALTNTQVHWQTPTDYLVWHAIGDIAFTTEWQEYDGTMLIEGDMDGTWSIAFNLNAEVKTAVDFYFDDLSWQVLEAEDPTDISTLTDVIYADDATGSKGSTTNLTINLKNEQATNAYSFDLKLPAGVTVAKDNNDEYIYTLSDRHKGHTVDSHYNETTNVYSFALLSVQSKQLTGNDGVVMTLKLNVADDVALGDYAVKIQNAKYSLTDGSEKVSMPETISKLTIENYIKGDVNGDRDVDIADAVCIVNYVVGKPTPAFNAAAADANGDGDVDIADAVRIVNLVVGKIQALARQRQTSLPEPE